MIDILKSDVKTAYEGWQDDEPSEEYDPYSGAIKHAMKIRRIAALSPVVSLCRPSRTSL